MNDTPDRLGSEMLAHARVVVIDPVTQERKTALISSLDCLAEEYSRLEIDILSADESSTIRHIVIDRMNTRLAINILLDAITRNRANEPRPSSPVTQTHAHPAPETSS